MTEETPTIPAHYSRKGTEKLLNNQSLFTTRTVEIMKDRGLDIFAIFMFFILRHVQVWLVFLQSGGDTPGKEALTAVVHL